MNTNTAGSVGQLTLMEIRARVFQDFVDDQFHIFFASRALNVQTELSFFQGTGQTTTQNFDHLWSTSLLYLFQTIQNAIS